MFPNDGKAQAVRQIHAEVNQATVAVHGLYTPVQVLLSSSIVSVLTSIMGKGNKKWMTRLHRTGKKTQQTLDKGSCRTSISRSVSGTSADEQTGFSCLHYNIQGLRAHEGELTALIQLLPKPPSFICHGASLLFTLQLDLLWVTVICNLFSGGPF